MKKVIFFTLFCLLVILARPVSAGDIGININYPNYDLGVDENLYFGYITSASLGNLMLLESPAGTKRFRINRTGDIEAYRICDENGANCHDLSDGWSGMGGDGYIGDSQTHTAGGPIVGSLYGTSTGALDATIWGISSDQYPNWGIFYNEGDPDYIEFKTDGTVSSKIALDTGAAHFGLSGGNVGIGTANPQAKFHVEGQYAYFSGSVIDDSASGKNLLPNWQFESDTYWVDAPEQVSVADFNGVNHYSHDSDETSSTGCYNWARSDIIPVDPSKTYKYSLWIRSTDLTMNNYFGFYVYDANKTRITGSWDNPYFKTNQSDPNVWKLWNGFLGPSYAGGATGCDSDRTNGNDWCLPSNAAYVEIRFGSCYADGNNNGHTYYMYPEIEEFDPDNVLGPGAYDGRALHLGYHTINSNSNGWLYVGDQNGSVYGSRNFAASQLHAGLGSIYIGSSIYDGNSDLYLNDNVGIGTSDADGNSLKIYGPSGGGKLWVGTSNGRILETCDGCSPGNVVYMDNVIVDEGVRIDSGGGAGLSVMNSGGANIDGNVTITNGLLKLYKRSSVNPPTCNSTNEGAVFYSLNFDEPCFCNGSQWLTFSGGWDCQLY